jgi:tRNA1Val (adenine37-N6)-methyltransferase
MSVFRFKHFTIIQEKSALKVGTDALLLGSLVCPVSEGRILDIGSGTGVLSLMLAQRSPNTVIDAIELDPFAAEETELNFRNSPWSDRLFANHADFFTWNSNRKYDLIVSNPPFYKDGLKPEDPRKANSKHVAFDFLDFFQRCKELLNTDGKLWIILPSQSEKELTKEFMSVGFYPEIKVYVNGKPEKRSRMVLSLSNCPCVCTTTGFTIRNQDGYYSDQYKLLTKDFHDRKL